MDSETEEVSPAELREAWVLLSVPDRMEGFKLLQRVDQEEFFESLPAADQYDLLIAMPPQDRKSWIRLLPPDDAADLIQAADPEERSALVALLDDPTRKEVNALLAYAEDEAGGLMNPRFARLRPDMTVDEAITYLRKQSRERVETIYYAYVLSPEQHLLGVVSFRELITAQSKELVRDVMQKDLIVADEEMDQETVSKLVREHGLMAIPVVDNLGRMKGIVTVDDIVDVVSEEATEDIQKLGGTEALGEPYLQASIATMLRKRGLWLAILLLGETLTASAVQHFDDAISAVVVLSVFMPLIISSGGNSGSQATTLVIRALALGELRLRDWWRVVRRELAAGLVLGLFLGIIGFARVVLWQLVFKVYGPHYLLIALVVFASLTAVVTLGTLTGSILPFLLKRLGLDPASASAPLVATLVDVTGLIIYFSLATLILQGTLL